MRSVAAALCSLLGSLVLLSWPVQAQVLNRPVETQRLAPMGLLSLSSFIPNAGQIDPAVVYYGRGPGYTVYFTREQAVFTFQEPGTSAVIQPVVASPEVRSGTRAVTLALRFVGASPAVTLEGQKRGTAKVNYLTGSDPAKWQVGLPTYEHVGYRDLWPGVDLIFHAAKRQPKHELVLRPGASVKAVRLAYRGAEDLSLDAGGNLRIRTALGVLTEEAPRSYQKIGGRYVPVESRFVLETSADGERVYGFDLGPHDPNHPVTIDPALFLAYSTYLGGGLTDVGTAIAVDGAGNAFVTGYTESSNFPKTVGPTFKSGTKTHGFFDAFVAKFNPAGGLVYATYLGGNDADMAFGIAVKRGCAADCSAYVTGVTYSRDFPITTGALDRAISGGVDAFITMLKPDGTLSLGTPS
ncbi:MAG: SBBP repeat-containing protein, partial [bacterium]